MTDLNISVEFLARKIHKYPLKIMKYNTKILQIIKAKNNFRGEIHGRGKYSIKTKLKCFILEITSVSEDDSVLTRRQMKYYQLNECSKI